MKLINIGFGNMVSADRLVAIVSPESAPIKRIIRSERQRHAYRRNLRQKNSSVIFTDSDHIILSAVQPETVSNRLNNKEVVDEPLTDDSKG